MLAGCVSRICSVFREFTVDANLHGGDGFSHSLKKRKRYSNIVINQAIL